jgi:hypothetical protein
MSELLEKMLIKKFTLNTQYGFHLGYFIFDFVDIREISYLISTPIEKVYQKTGTVFNIS